LYDSTGCASDPMRVLIRLTASLRGRFRGQLDLLRIAADLTAFHRQGLLLVQTEFCLRLSANLVKVTESFSRGRDYNSPLIPSFRPRSRDFVL